MSEHLRKFIRWNCIYLSVLLASLYFCTMTTVSLDEASLATTTSSMLCPCTFVSQSQLNCSSKGNINLEECNTSSITSLTLNYNNISKLRYGHFTTLTDLTNLSLEHNWISTIEDYTFSDLRALACLSLEHNWISTITDYTFSDLRALVNLHLAYNKITTIQSETFAGMHALENLDLSKNSISTLKMGIFVDLKGLQYLNIGHNNLSDLRSGIFTNLTKLRDLNLAYNKITTIQSDAFAGLHGLERLSLEHNSISAFEELTFSDLRALVDLKLNNNNITDLKIGLFSNLDKLKPVNLEGNNFINLKPLVRTLLKNKSMSLLQTYQGNCSVYCEQTLRDPSLSSSGYTCKITHLTENGDGKQWNTTLNIFVELNEEEMIRTCADSSQADRCEFPTSNTNASCQQEIRVTVTGKRLQSVNTDTDNPNNRNLAICRDKKINLYQCLSMLLEEKGQNLVDNVNKIMDTVEELLLPAQTTSNSAILPNITRVLSLLMNLPDDVLESAQAQYNISQRILGAVDEISNSMQPDGLPFSSPNLVIGAHALSANNSIQRTITAGSANRGNDDDACKVYLPPSVLNVTSDTRITFALFRSEKVFEVMRRAKQKITSKPTLPTGQKRGINSNVMSATVKDFNVINSTDQIIITLPHKIVDSRRPSCVFWNASQSDWSSKGCTEVNSTNVYTVCKCNHLTHFALLMDIYGAGESLNKGHQHSLTLVSIIGCSVSLMALLITLFTYWKFQNLRRDIPSKLLINLCLALLVFNLVFVAGLQEYSLKKSIVCKIVAVLLHYSLLAAFCWMAVEAFYMYYSLVVVFRSYISKLILKCSLFGWGVPLVIVSITLIINKTENYGSPNGNSCWLTGMSLYLAFAIPVFIILLVNFTCFTLVVRQLALLSKTKLTKSNTVKTSQQLRGAFGVCVLLGLTWVFAVFLFEEVIVVFSYLFVICNSLQGLFIFVHNCLLKKDVCNAWRRWLNCKRKSTDVSNDTVTKGSVLNRDSSYPDVRKMTTSKYHKSSL